MKIKMLRTVKVAKGANLIGDRVYAENDLPGGVSAKGLIKEGHAVEVPEGTARGAQEPDTRDRVNLRDRGTAASEDISEDAKRKFAQDEGTNFQDRDFAEHEEVDEEQEVEEEDPETKEKRKVKRKVRVKRKKQR